jgi:hypothetical protein
MQRFERELEEILHDLGCDSTSAESQVGDSSAPASEPGADNASRARKVSPPRLLVRSFVRRLIGSACVLLAVTLLVLPFSSALSALLVALSLAILLVSLKQSRAAGRHEGDLAPRDLSWMDVTVQAKPGTPGTPRKRDDSFWSR